MTMTKPSKPPLVLKRGRLLPLWQAPGEAQMALDRALLAGLEQWGPILRFYTWEPVAISLGYHQQTYPTAWEALTYQGEPVELVRRPTGGRAVLHQGDLCYSLLMPHFPGTRRQVYERCCQFLRLGWQSLGIDLTFGAGQRGYIHHPSCFSTATAADLVTAAGYKLIGSAQLHRGGGILQQGSMRLNPDPVLFFEVFGEAVAPPSPMPTIPAIITALHQAAQTDWGCPFPAQPLTAQEWARLNTLGFGTTNPGAIH
ncbi:lipoyl protein ligase domain-containing protein [Spirulina sp. CCNP1310]|uniref:lipoyl protein ligase domain-containing protein n=1 Tax=Spirulina sp. CCNP1310 TaxID=3110249 RepID=UPI003A4C6257